METCLAHTEQSEEHVGFCMKDTSTDKLLTTLDFAIEVLEDLQKVITEGKPKTLRVKFGERIVAELPVAFTFAGACAAGAIALLVSKLSVELES
ncbi:MAG: hypothetical protein SNJ70_05025 [Armatimonadota bacterium]